MHGIYLMAIITTLIGLAVFGAAIWFMTAPEDRRMVLLAGLLTLPLSPLVFYLIRLPIISVVNTVVNPDISPLLLVIFIQLLYAPLTEEPAKLLPLLIPAIRRRITPQNFVSFAAALGVGFGIGEAWFLANQVASVPEYAGMPFYLFTGFASERLTVMIMHAFFTGAALRGISRGRAAVGIPIAMGLHWLGNAPIALIAMDVGGLGEAAWRGIVSIWVTLYSIFGLVMLSLWRFPQMSRPIPRRALTHARCPECNTVYKIPLLVMNLPSHRCEQCPNCKHWHWIDRWADPDAEPVTN